MVFSPNASITNAKEAQPRTSIDTDRIQYFTDAAWRPDSRAGLGWIAREQRNKIVGQDTKPESQIKLSLMAEALAIREALSQASIRNHRDFILASYSLHMVKLINSNQFQLEIYGIIQDIIKLSLDLKVTFVYVHRSENTEADLLAKSALVSVLDCTGLLPV